MARVKEEKSCKKKSLFMHLHSAGQKRMMTRIYAQGLEYMYKLSPSIYFTTPYM